MGGVAYGNVNGGVFVLIRWSALQAYRNLGDLDTKCRVRWRQKYLSAGGIPCCHGELSLDLLSREPLPEKIVQGLALRLSSPGGPYQHWDADALLTYFISAGVSSAGVVKAVFVKPSFFRDLVFRLRGYVPADTPSVCIGGYRLVGDRGPAC